MDAAPREPMTLTPAKVASIFEVDESDLDAVNRAKRMEQRVAEHKQFLADSLTPDALQRIASGEATLDEILLYGEAR